ncbi:MAG TPA: hypothetical protein VKU01_01100 [Bryobacteraceae bacterium]|nr:hypothetical protein [Bryobacteraceae bacterium]
MDPNALSVHSGARTIADADAQPEHFFAEFHSIPLALDNIAQERFARGLRVPAPNRFDNADMLGPQLLLVKARGLPLEVTEPLSAFQIALEQFN